MNPRLLLPSLLCLAATAALGGCASYEIDGVAGYTAVQADAPGGVSPFFDDDSGLRLAANGSRSFLSPGLVRGQGGTSLRGNVNASWATYDADTGADDADLNVYSVQLGPSFRLSGFGLFAEAGATAGGAYATLDAVGDDDDQFSWAARPYVRAGIVRDLFLVGIEGGYELTGLDFDLDGAGGRGGEDYENWYVGLLVGIRLTR